MNDQELVDTLYDTLMKAIFGADGTARSTLFGKPIEKDDIKSIIVVAYYLG